MPNIDKQKVNKKKRLGRGLGSLLSTDMHAFEDASPAKAPVQPLSKTTQKNQQAKTNPNSQSPKIENQQSAAPVPTNAMENSGLTDENRIWSLPIDKVNPNKTQPRKDFLKEHLQELADSIKEQGLLQPITVRRVGENYEIIAGERRWRATQLAGLHEVPAIIKDVDDQKSMELALIENLQRENLNPVEEAMAYQLLIDDYDLSQQEVAKKKPKKRTS